MQNSSVRVRVPASTSNLGSGFDTLGLALNLYCTLTVHRATDPGIRFISKISDQNRVSATAMLSETAGLFFAKTKTPAFGTEIEISSEIPPARGMGASAALRVGFLAALGRLARLCMAKTDLLEMATALEHHPDNASPAIYGGFTVSGFFGGKVHCIRLPVSPNLRVVTLVPDLEINTTRARTLLPESYSKADTAHALNRCGFLTSRLLRLPTIRTASRDAFDDQYHLANPISQTTYSSTFRCDRSGHPGGRTWRFPQRFWFGHHLSYHFECPRRGDGHDARLRDRLFPRPETG